MSSNIIYSVISSKDKLICIDTKNGATKGTYPFTGELINGPIVTGGDRCTATFNTPSGKKVKIFKLPNFSTITSFNA